MKLLINATSNQSYESAERQPQGLGGRPPAEVGGDLDFEGMSGIQVCNEYIKRDTQYSSSDDRMKDLYKIIEKMWLEKCYKPKFWRGLE